MLFLNESTCNPSFKLQTEYEIDNQCCDWFNTVVFWPAVSHVKLMQRRKLTLQNYWWKISWIPLAEKVYQSKYICFITCITKYGMVGGQGIKDGAETSTEILGLFPCLSLMIGNPRILNNLKTGQKFLCLGLVVRWVLKTSNTNQY